MREGRLGYNSSNGRYGILSSDLWIDTGLHCGECLQILMDGKWVQTRMEMDVARNWYLVGTPYRGDLEYIRARRICQVKCVNFFIFYRRSDLDRRFDVISLIGIIIGKASHILPHRAVGVLVNQNKSHQFEENTDSSSHAVRSLFLLLTSH